MLPEYVPGEHCQNGRFQDGHHKNKMPKVKIVIFVTHIPFIMNKQILALNI